MSTITMKKKNTVRRILWLSKSKKIDLHPKANMWKNWTIRTKLKKKKRKKRKNPKKSSYEVESEEEEEEEEEIHAEDEVVEDAPPFRKC